MGMGIVEFGIGLAVGFIICYLWMMLKSKGNQSTNDNSNNLAAEKAQLEGKLSQLESSLNNYQDQINKYNEKQQSLIALNSESETTIKHLKERLATQTSEIEKMQEQFKLQFENIANKILEEKSERFSEQHKLKLSQVLNPFSEKIVNFEEIIRKNQIESAKERSTLAEQIKQLTNLNNKMLEDAQNLTKALKGDNKSQGNWGELILERILEESGLIRGEEYDTQYTDTNIEGQMVRPDVVVKLPDHKHIIIDSKVSLLAYERYTSADDEDEKQTALKQHIESVKAHIKGLSDKNYHSAIGLDSPEFVLLFIPIESSFSLTIQQDRDIYSYAWEKKVVIVSPSTLLATLRTISSVWKHERQTKNALEIARQAGKLYDKFVGFIADVEAVKQRLAQGQDSVDAAINKLHTGNGNLVRSVERLKKLGAKVSKEIPENYLEDDGEDSDLELDDDAMKSIDE